MLRYAALSLIPSRRLARYENRSGIRANIQAPSKADFRFRVDYRDRDGRSPKFSFPQSHRFPPLPLYPPVLRKGFHRRAVRAMRIARFFCVTRPK
jgi:hypothetical protein